MHKMKKLFIMTAGMLLVTAALTGCGNRDTTREQVSPVISEGVEESAEKPAEKPAERPELKKGWHMDEKNFVQWTNEGFVNADGENMFPQPIKLNIPVLEGVTEIEENSAEKGVGIDYQTVFDGGNLDISISNGYIDEGYLKRSLTISEQNPVMVAEEIGNFVFVHPAENEQEDIWEHELRICDRENMTRMVVFIDCYGIDCYAMRDRMIAEIRSCLQSDKKVVTDTPEAETAAALTTLTDATQHQISAFIGMLDNYHETVLPADTVSAEHCLWLFEYFLNDCGWDLEGGHEDDLPFGWKDRQISREEFDIFFESGWGIDIPDDFSYTANYENTPVSPYAIAITEEGWECNADGSLYEAIGGEVAVTGYDNGVYSLSGTFTNGAMDDEALTEKTFTATAVESGDERIFDGLQITGFSVEE